MEKTNLYSVDEFGVTNYNFAIISWLSFVVYMMIGSSLSYLTLLSETSVIGSPVGTYRDAFWLMIMSSTTIGFGDVYPITFIGRVCVFIMFILGVGILGGVCAVFANKVFGFADTNVKNRELRKQNEEILAQNKKIYDKLAMLEDKLEKFNHSITDK